MENKKIIMVRHHPMHLPFTNKVYLNQLGEGVDPNDVIFIDATSRNRDFDFIKEISPFYVGPVVASDGKVSKTLENFWQFGKVYEGKTIFHHYISRRQKEDLEFVCSDEEGNPTEDWFKVRDYGFNIDHGYRHPFSGKPLYQYYVEDGKVVRLGYIESRKKVYIKEYAKLVYNSSSFKRIKKLLDEGKTIALVDFDAYNYYDHDVMVKRYEADKKRFGSSFSYSLNDYLNIKTMKDVVNFPGLLMGHGFVLKLLLQGDIEVVNGEVIDHSHVLDI